MFHTTPERWGSSSGGMTTDWIMWHTDGSNPYNPVGKFSRPLILGHVDGRSLPEGVPDHPRSRICSRETREYPEGKEHRKEIGYSAVLRCPSDA